MLFLRKEHRALSRNMVYRALSQNMVCSRYIAARIPSAWESWSLNIHNVWQGSFAKDTYFGRALSQERRMFAVKSALSIFLRFFCEKDLLWQGFFSQETNWCEQHPDLESRWIWANRPSDKGTRLLFNSIKAIIIISQESYCVGHVDKRNQLSEKVPCTDRSLLWKSPPFKKKFLLQKSPAKINLFCERTLQKRALSVQSIIKNLLLFLQHFCWWLVSVT